MTGPTSYPELNGVLRELVASARSILADSFCGAYLQGSFATGEADVHSDVDFVVVTHGEVEADQLDGLQEMHKRIHGLDVPWAQHLEGSYIPKALLRRRDSTRTPFLFLDNGASELVRDEHCDTAVVRWLLREHGVVLVGPDPKQLIDPVSPATLRSEALATMPEYASSARHPVRRSGRDEPLAAAVRCSDLLPDAAHARPGDGHLETGVGRLGTRRPGGGVGGADPARVGRPARPVAACSSTGRSR